MNKKKVLECANWIKNWGVDWSKLETIQMWTICSSIIDFMIDYMETEESDIDNCFEKGVESTLRIHNVTLTEDPCFIAEFKRWDGTIVKQLIKEEMIDDITAAVIGQYYYANNDTDLVVFGNDFSQVNIYKMEKQNEK